MLVRGLELQRANGGRFEISQLLIADDTTLLPDSEKKLCILVSQVGGVCKKIKLRVNVRVKLYCAHGMY